MSKLQKKPSALKREHPALQNMEFLIFSTFLGHFFTPGSVAGALLHSVLPCGSVNVDLRAYTTAGTGTKAAAEALLQSVLHFLY
jgi:hypothetical protein